ncbi:MAG: multiprotein bridging factor aMBF1 [Acidilobaceae archaeon]
MTTRDVLYCEICGVKAENLYRVLIDESEFNICARCLSKLGSKAIIITQQERREEKKPKAKAKPVKTYPPEGYDLVEDFGERVKRAREERGWSEKVLAQKLRVSIDVIRRIESGKYKPTIHLARSLENILKIKLLTPTEEAEEEVISKPDKVTLGDIVVIRKRGEK